MHLIFPKKSALIFILLSAIFFLPEMAVEANSSSQEDQPNKIFLPIISSAYDDASEERVMSANNRATSPAIFSNGRNANELEPQQIIFTARSTNLSTGQRQIANCLQRIGLVRDVTYMKSILLSSINTRLFLYNTSQNFNAEQVVTRLQDATSPGSNRITSRRCRQIQTAEPNWIYTANQWIGGGSPWKDSTQNLAILPIDDESVKFNEQQALVNLVAGNLNSLENFSGEGVRVAILDTAPINASMGENILIDGAQQWQLTINISKMKNEYATINNIPCDTDEDLIQEYTELMKEHGIYVASLVNAVAPSTEIELYRVLNHCGVGDLLTLMNALDQFIDNNGTQPAVINMSFGAVLPQNMLWAEESPKSILENLIEIAKENGIAIVAASGNGSEYTTPIPAEWPASIPSVLSVGASDGVKGMSCFSNQGDILAPGGNSPGNLNFKSTTDIPNTKTLDGTAMMPTDCKARMDECSENPDMCIIGQNSDGGLSYLKGTSFSSPMVAGIVALAKGAHPNKSVDDLFASIQKGAIQASQNPDLLIAQKNISN